MSAGRRVHAGIRGNIGRATTSLWTEGKWKAKCPGQRKLLHEKWRPCNRWVGGKVGGAVVGFAVKAREGNNDPRHVHPRKFSTVQVHADNVTNLVEARAMNGLALRAPTGGGGGLEGTAPKSRLLSA